MKTTDFLIMFLMVLMTVYCCTVALQFDKLTEVQKQTRNEIQELNQTISRRFECIGALIKGDCILQVNP